MIEQYITIIIGTKLKSKKIFRNFSLGKGLVTKYFMLTKVPRQAIMSGHCTGNYPGEENQ